MEFCTAHNFGPWSFGQGIILVNGGFGECSSKHINRVSFLKHQTALCNLVLLFHISQSPFIWFLITKEMHCLAVAMTVEEDQILFATLNTNLLELGLKTQGLKLSSLVEYFGNDIIL
ncbi:hypothetical protein ACOSP7_001362 [Xanthoceras sorbifolium]